MPVTPKPKVIKFPKSLGACVDLLYETRAERLLMEKQIEPVKARETALREYIMTNFAAEDLDGAKGKKAIASISLSTQAIVTDWKKLWDYVVKNKAFDLMQQRVAITAVRERWDNKKAIPGVEPITVKTLSLNKAGV